MLISFPMSEVKFYSIFYTTPPMLANTHFKIILKQILIIINDSLRMYTNDEIRMYNFDRLSRNNLG